MQVLHNQREGSVSNMDSQVIEGELLTPLPRKQGESITMSFLDAMREIVSGKKVKRISWPSQTDHCLLKDGWVSIYTKGDFHSWNINDGDVEGQDWIIVKEGN